MRRIALFLFAAQFFALDVAFRGPLTFLREPRAIAGAVASVALWTLLWTLRDHRGARPLLALVAGGLFATQCLFFRNYHTAIDAQAVASGAHNWPEVRPIVVRMLPLALATIAAVAVAEYALLSARRVGRALRAPALAVTLLAAFVAIPLRDATPDLRFLDALRFVGARTRAADVATHVTVPNVPSTRKRLPNVLVVLTESVRASDACSAHEPDCESTPAVNAAVPDRVPLREMRAVASYTALSLSAIITGRSQEGTRAAIVEAPTVFDFVRAARGDGGQAPKVAYWSSQSAGVFESDVRESIDSFFTVETLLGHAVDDEDEAMARGLDRLLAARFSAQLPSLSAPYFVLLHLSGTHAPYFVEDQDAPFRPYGHEIAWSRMAELHNAYRNAIHEQDKAIAACLRAFLAAQEGSPYVIFFTSDHGEAFGEHGAIHHGQNFYDEQIHVPAWVAFGNDALSSDEAENLRTHEWDTHVTHLDLLPSILDAYGLLDGFAVAPYAAHFRGRSLFARSESPAPIPVTNCTPLFPCPLNTWGMLDGNYALEAQRWDADWNCVDLSTGAEHLDDARCRALRQASIGPFPQRPNGRANP